MRGARSVRTARCAPRAIAAALIAVLPLAGCAGNGESASDTADDRGSFEATPLPEKLGAGRTVVQSRTRIAPGQVGLEVLTWQISVDTEQFNQAIVTYGAPAVATADEVSLNANGLILRAVNANTLDSLRDALGGSALEMRTWLGTSTVWRPLVNVPIGSAMVEVDGIARERSSTQAQLMARTWPMLMEDGACIAVEMVPQLATGAAQASVLHNANQLAGDVVQSCHMSLELQRGTAWLLTCEANGFVETDAEAPARARDATTLIGPPSPHAAPASGKIGARVVNLGAATLLAAPERPGARARRTVLLMIPHLPDNAFPVEDAPKPMEPSKQ